MKFILKITYAFSFILLTAFIGVAHPDRIFFQLKIYKLKTSQQEERVDKYLKEAYLPALHRAGIKSVGVFKPIKKDSLEQLVYVLVPFKSLDQFMKLDAVIAKDKQYLLAGTDYIDAKHTNSPFQRIESILLQAFTDMPGLGTPKLTSTKSDRVYELRSYEGHTEKIYVNKVEMFNKGGEIKLFNRLGFNAVFYGEVLSGSTMPNLMYMTTFNNMKERDEHWKAFVDDAEWKKLSSMPEYRNNVSRNDTRLLRPTEYSDY